MFNDPARATGFPEEEEMNSDADIAVPARRKRPLLDFLSSTFKSVTSVVNDSQNREKRNT